MRKCEVGLKVQTSRGESCELGRVRVYVLAACELLVEVRIDRVIRVYHFEVYVELFELFKFSHIEECIELFELFKFSHFEVCVASVQIFTLRGVYRIFQNFGRERSSSLSGRCAEVFDFEVCGCQNVKSSEVFFSKSPKMTDSFPAFFFALFLS